MSDKAFDPLIETPESDLVEAILRDRLLSRGIGVPSSIGGSYDFELCVAPDELGLSKQAFGDADAIFMEHGCPDRASAVQFKRVKISATTLVTGQPNKLRKLQKAVHQANALHRVGFAFVWVNVLIVADMRSFAQGTGFAAPGLELIQRVRNAIPLGKLDTGVGVEVCELTQVSDKPANHRGGAGWHLLQAAEEQAQPLGLTDRLRVLFARRGATQHQR